MPAGSTHDRITLWSLPPVAGLTFIQTGSSNLTLIVSGGFLLGGLMFGPDLDIYSRQYQRWGFLRWIWLPYQKSLRHRAFLSHGPLIGTALRMLYLAIWIIIFTSLGLLAGNFFWGMGWNWLEIIKTGARSLFQHYRELIALYIGLEIGAMSHSLSDWGGSTYKRFKKQGFQALLPTKTKKRKTTKRRKNSQQTKSRLPKVTTSRKNSKD